MSDLPKSVEIHEEGPREGFQTEKRLFSAAERAGLIDALSACGLAHIQIGSFVSPAQVPNMANTEEVARLIRRREGTRYTALWLNMKGFERALACPGLHVEGRLALYASDAFCRRNNGCSLEELYRRQHEWLDRYEAAGIAPRRAGIMAAFGCNYQGEVPLAAVLDAVRFVADLCRGRGHALPAIYLADTMGWATPQEVKRRVGAVRELVPEAEIGLHLHDTRGLGAANFYAGLEMGVRLFDASVAGLGGCPFAALKSLGSAGNVCTEDMVFMCEEMGIETGVDLEALIEAAQHAERLFGRPLAGRLMHSGSLGSFRARAA